MTTGGLAWLDLDQLSRTASDLSVSILTSVWPQKAGVRAFRIPQTFFHGSDAGPWPGYTKWLFMAAMSAAEIAGRKRFAMLAIQRHLTRPLQMDGDMAWTLWITINFLAIALPSKACKWPIAAIRMPSIDICLPPVDISVENCRNGRLGDHSSAIANRRDAIDGEWTATAITMVGSMAENSSRWRRRPSIVDG